MAPGHGVLIRVTSSWCRLAEHGCAARGASGEVTGVSGGAMVERCEQAAARSRVDVELLDLRTLSPWDKAAVCASVGKTHRCLTVHEGNLTACLVGRIA